MRRPIGGQHICGEATHALTFIPLAAAHVRITDTAAGAFGLAPPRRADLDVSAATGTAALGLLDFKPFVRFFAFAGTFVVRAPPALPLPEVPMQVRELVPRERGAAPASRGIPADPTTRDAQISQLSPVDLHKYFASDVWHSSQGDRDFDFVPAWQHALLNVDGPRGRRIVTTSGRAAAARPRMSRVCRSRQLRIHPFAAPSRDEFRSRPLSCQQEDTGPSRVNAAKLAGGSPVDRPVVPFNGVQNGLRDSPPVVVSQERRIEPQLDEVTFDWLRISPHPRNSKSVHGRSSAVYYDHHGYEPACGFQSTGMMTTGVRARCVAR